MTRRELLGTVAASPLAAATTRRPNVLFLMSDDMRVELGCYGSQFGALTPNLDALASTGVRFDRNYCQFPLCNPSRSSLLTGRTPLTTGVLGNRTAFRDAHPAWTSLPQLFRENGYTSVRAGKIFHGEIDDPKAWSDVKIDSPTDDASAAAAGLSKTANSDRIVVLKGDGEGSGDAVVADRTIAALREHKARPFFIACGFSKPHSPPAAPRRFFDLYDPAKLTLPPDYAPRPTVPPGFPKASIRPQNADLFVGRDSTEASAKEVIRAYLASTSWADYNVGRVLKELDALGLRDTTIVVFVADHGYQLGERGKWSKAGSLFEMGTRVPMMIRAPGMQGNGRASLRPVQSLDLYATVADLCGLTIPPGNQGHTLRPLLENPAAEWDKPAFSIWSEDGTSLHGVAVRTAKWRYAEFGRNAANGAMLFDVIGDPRETVNLAGREEHAATCRQLSTALRSYIA